MNTEETVRADAVINVTTTKLVIHSLEIVAGALTVIVMQNAIKVRYKMHHLESQWEQMKMRKKITEKTKAHCFFEWMLLFLTIVECNSGTYGENCTYQCGECINDMICDHVNGKCSEGCKPGWKTTDTCHECMYMNWITYLYVWRIIMFCSHVIMLRNRAFVKQWKWTQIREST